MKKKTKIRIKSTRKREERGEGETVRIEREKT